MRKMKKKQNKPMLFTVRKYIKATSALQAIRKDKNTPVHDVWIENDWQNKHLADAIGFHTSEEEDDE